MKTALFYFLLLPLSLIAQISSLQTIISTSGGIQAKSATENAFGDIFIAGTLPGGLDDGDIVLIKMVNGNVSLTKQIPLPEVQNATDIAAFPNGDICIVGTNAQGVFASTDIILMRLDASLNILWTKILGSADNDNINTIDVLSGDRLRLSGSVSVNGILSPATLILDSTGNILSEKYLNVPNFASPNFSAYEMADGKLVMTGSNRLGQICDSTGVLTSAIPGELAGQSVAACSGANGNYVVAYSDNLGSPTGSSVVVASYVPGSFFTEWLNKYNTTNDEIAAGIFFHQNVFTLITVLTTSNGLQSIGITLLDSIGNQLSSKRVIPAGYDYINIYRCRQNSDGSVMVSGMIQNSSFLPNGFVMKISPEGEAGCNPPIFNFSVSANSAFPGSAVFNQSTTLMNVLSSPIATTLDTAFQVTVPCLVVSDETKILKDQPMIYPNPGQGIFFIPGLQPASVAEVFDLHGRRIQTQQSSEGRIDIQDCMPGIYLIKYSDRQGKTQIHRVIVR
ncbi:MAG: hypothetical protein RLZZ46_576 [Bacteroidota bacterium]|jgi:hypothetical protein